MYFFIFINNNLIFQVDSKILHPKNTWSDKDGYDKVLKKLAASFKKNFVKYQDGAGKEILSGGPQ